MGDERGRFGRAAGANVLGNAAKIVVEGAVGVAFGSVALVADAAHSLADLVASAVVFVWGSAVYDEPDETHPHGHQRIEPLTALFVAAVIVVLGVNLLVESVRGLVEGPGVAFDPLLLAAIGFSVVDMYVVYRYTKRTNAGLESPSLAALAADCLNDIYTSLAAVVGVIGVLVGYPLLDPLAGAAVSLLVVSQGVEIGRENVRYLVGSAAPPEQRETVESALSSHPAVEGIHDLSVFYDGTDLEVEGHVEVDGDMSVREAHEVETELVERLRAIEVVGDVHVHLDPSGVGEWKDTAEGVDPTDERETAE